MSSTRVRNVAILLVVVCIAAIAALAIASQPPGTLGTDLSKAKGKTLEQETAEHDVITQLRITARQNERAAGRLGRVEPIRAAAAAQGWTDEKLFHPTHDDWEPAVAASPVDGHVYIATTRYGGPKACKQCSDPAIVVRASSNGGTTFGPANYVCACARVKGQFDPEIELANDGTLYTVWMNDFNPGVVFAKSSDHGQTWTTPISLDGKLNWSDKPILAISANGKHVYVAFNHSDSYVAASHDFGETFSAPVKTNDDDRYYFAGGGNVTGGGTIATFSESSYTQSSTGPIEVTTITTTNGGQTWTPTLADTVEEQPPCTDVGCPTDFYGTQTALAGDSTGRLVLMYQGALVPAGPQRMFVRRSDTQGATWSGRVDVTGAPSGTNAAFPALTATGTGDFRGWFMDDRNGASGWNVWYVRSTNGGGSWSTPVRLSNVTSGTVYKSAAGFAEPYGDYGEIDITNNGKSFAAWGEGIDYVGPGRHLVRAPDVVSLREIQSGVLGCVFRNIWLRLGEWEAQEAS
jgi:hypothetical protein